jgi:hypothetical protein
LKSTLSVGIKGLNLVARGNSKRGNGDYNSIKFDVIPAYWQESADSGQPALYSRLTIFASSSGMTEGHEANPESPDRAIAPQ